MPSGFNPMLSMSYNRGLHSAEHETGDRPAPVGISESPNPWPKRRSGLIDQASLSCKSASQFFFDEGVLWLRCYSEVRGEKGTAIICSALLHPRQHGEAPDALVAIGVEEGVPSGAYPI